MEKEKSIRDDKVVILCGGRGARLRPATDTVPKALVPLNGRPILDYILDFYRQKGFFKFVMCVGYKAAKIMEYYANPPQGTDITFSDAGEQASMLERLWKVRDQVGERFFISYGDTFIDLDLDRLLSSHVRSMAQATMVTARVKSPFGLVTVDGDGLVSSFVEKPLLNYYIGCFLCEKSAFDYVDREMLEKHDAGGLIDFFLRLKSKRLLAAFESTGFQITFNTESERRNAEKILGKFYTYTENE